MTSAQAGLLAAVFLASAVEFVEAYTIVLAMGITREWRSYQAQKRFHRRIPQAYAPIWNLSK